MRNKIPTKVIVKTIEEPIETSKENVVRQGTPAVMFEDMNVYTKDGCVGINPVIYNTLYSINAKAANNAIQTMDADTVSLNHIIESNTALNIMKCTLDNFKVTIENIYDVFVSRMNDLFTPEEATERAEVFTKKFQSFGHLDFFIRQYMDCDTDNVNTSVVVNGIIAFINGYGADIYNTSRIQLNTFISEFGSTDPETVRAVYEDFDRNFSLMMSDMAYEVNVFILNLEKCRPMYRITNKTRKTLLDEFEF